MTFVVLRESMSTVQCMLVASADAGVSTQMVRFATSLGKESIVNVEGVVSLPKEPLKATTQQSSCDSSNMPTSSRRQRVGGWSEGNEGGGRHRKVAESIRRMKQ